MKVRKIQTSKFVQTITTLIFACLVATAAEAKKSIKWESNGANLIFNTQNQQLHIELFNQQKKIIDLSDIRFNDTHAISWCVRAQNETVITLVGEFPASVDYYKTVTDTEHRFVELNISKVNGGFRINAEPKWGRTTSIYFNYLGDHFFGLSEPLQPDNQLSPDLIGNSINVDVNSEDAYLHENYATVYSAFYMSSFGYGAFFDSFARGRYEFSINGKNKITHDTGTLDWYVFIGKDGADIQSSYFSLIGAPKTVPAWGLGPVGWRDQNNGGANEILDDVKKMRQLKIPFTSWFVDRPYSDGANAWSKMNFNSLFENPAEWIQKLRTQEGLEFMTWTSTATFGDTTIGKHLLGKFSYLDLSDPITVNKFQKNLAEQQYSYGVKGHKMDRADEAFPVAEIWTDKSVTEAGRRNLYPVLMAKVHDQALRAKWGDDQMTFARAAYQRSQPYLSAIWAGDPRTSWEGLQSNYANAMRASFIGFPVWGTDVGGYQGDGFIAEDLYLRWMQAGSMSGLFEIKFDGAGGAGRDRLPWQYDEKFQNIFRKICEERMLLIPYLYSLSHTSATTGTLMQPLAYRHLKDKNTYSIYDEFYLGSALLIAPVLDDGEKRSVYLPEGNWVDFNNTTIRYKGGRTIAVNAPLDTIPRFIAENSIYVLGDIYKGSNRTWDSQPEKLSVTVNPSESNSSSQFIYVDMLDGDKHKTITLERKKNTISVKVPALASESGVVVLLASSPKSVQLNGKNIDVKFDEKTKQLKVLMIKGDEANLEVYL